jgi:hypothetical protein
VTSHHTHQPIFCFSQPKIKSYLIVTGKVGESYAKHLREERLPDVSRPTSKVDPSLSVELQPLITIRCFCLCMPNAISTNDAERTQP